MSKDLTTNNPPNRGDDLTPQHSGEWVSILSPRCLEAHRQWDEDGRVGRGRLVLVDADLSGAHRPHSYLVAARFERCIFDHAYLGVSDMEEVELLDCRGHHLRLDVATLNDARILCCAFPEANLALSDLFHAHLEGCDLSRLSLFRADCSNMRVRDCCLANAHLDEATLDGCHFVGCDLRGASLSGASVSSARFERCDLRESLLNRLVIDQTTFRDCGFWNASGRPCLTGRLDVDRVDVSADFDGTDIRDPKELLALLTH